MNLGSIAHPEHPGSYKESSALPFGRSYVKTLLTSPHGLAMKVGDIPYFIPMLLATSLNRQALSAILEASV